MIQNVPQTKNHVQSSSVFLLTLAQKCACDASGIKSLYAYYKKSCIPCHCPFLVYKFLQCRIKAQNLWSQSFDKHYPISKNWKHLLVVQVQNILFNSGPLFSLIPNVPQTKNHGPSSSVFLLTTLAQKCACDAFGMKFLYAYCKKFFIPCHCFFCVFLAPLYTYPSLTSSPSPLLV